MSDPRIRTIKIKTNVVKRLTKEKLTYEKEAEQQRERVRKYKEEGRDDADIRKQEEVLAEAFSMIPDCQRRLSTAYRELKDILQSEQDLKEAEEYTLASQILEEAKPELPTYT